MFRPGHNLTFTGMIQQSTWEVEETSRVESAAASKSVPGAHLRYAFHVNLFSNTGVAFGTSVTSFLHEGQIGQVLTPGWSVTFPSILLGAVQNLSRNQRFSLAMEYAAVYFHRLRVNRKGSSDGIEPAPSEQVVLSLTPDSISPSLHYEFFFHDLFALSVLLGHRTVFTSCFGSCTSSAFANEVRFTQVGWYLGVGVNWRAESVIGE